MVVDRQMVERVKTKAPLVSVWMLTYNHDKSVEKALDSILAQNTNFPYEIVIGDDYSTDNTIEILKKYQATYPNIVKPIFRNKNIGIHRNFVETWNKCCGEYVAFLEGDDYWTDEQKLDNQVRFLIDNPDYVMCYHNTMEVDEISGSEKTTNDRDPLISTTKELLLKGWYIRTGSMMARKAALKGFPAFYYDYPSTDYLFHVLISENGPIRFINKVSSVYRRHLGGITQQFKTKEISFYLQKFKLMEELDAYYNFKYYREIKSFKRMLYADLVFLKLKSLSSPVGDRDLLKFVLKADKKRLIKRILVNIKKKFKKPA
jgi:glycosyltransferase involved in cell wall biosynthesis